MNNDQFQQKQFTHFKSMKLILFHKVQCITAALTADLAPLEHRRHGVKHNPASPLALRIGRWQNSQSAQEIPDNQLFFRCSNTNEADPFLRDPCMWIIRSGMLHLFPRWKWIPFSGWERTRVGEKEYHYGNTWLQSKCISLLLLFLHSHILNWMQGVGFILSGLLYSLNLQWSTAFLKWKAEL